MSVVLMQSMFIMNILKNIYIFLLFILISVVLTNSGPTVHGGLTLLQKETHTKSVQSHHTTPSLMQIHEIKELLTSLPSVLNSYSALDERRLHIRKGYDITKQVVEDVTVEIPDVDINTFTTDVVIKKVYQSLLDFCSSKDDLFCINIQTTKYSTAVLSGFGYWLEASRVYVATIKLTVAFTGIQGIIEYEPVFKSEEFWSIFHETIGVSNFTICSDNNTCSVSIQKPKSGLEAFSKWMKRNHLHIILPILLVVAIGIVCLYLFNRAKRRKTFKMKGVTELEDGKGLHVSPPQPFTVNSSFQADNPGLTTQAILTDNPAFTMHTSTDTKF